MKSLMVNYHAEKQLILPSLYQILILKPIIQHSNFHTKHQIQTFKLHHMSQSALHQAVQTFSPPKTKIMMIISRNSIANPKIMMIFGYKISLLNLSANKSLRNILKNNVNILSDWLRVSVMKFKFHNK